MMKRRILLLLGCIATVATMPAAPIDSIFASMPSRLLPFVSRDNRLDCLDLYNNNMQAVAQNELGERTRLLKKTADYMHLKISEASRMEIKLLTHEGDTLVGVAHTVLTPAGDSRVRFYTTTWQERTDVRVPHPDPATLLEKPDSISDERFAEWKADAGGPWVRAFFSPDNDKLTYVLSTETVRREWQDAVARCLRLKEFRWNGKNFLPIEPE